MASLRSRMSVLLNIDKTLTRTDDLLERLDGTLDQFDATLAEFNATLARFTVALEQFQPVVAKVDAVGSDLETSVARVDELATTLTGLTGIAGPAMRLPDQLRKLTGRGKPEPGESADEQD